MSGDGFINTTSLTVNNFATGGTGVTGDISDIAHTFTFSVNDDVIGNFTSTVINDVDGYELSGNPQAIRTDRIIDALGFSALQIGTISNVKATGLGSGYELSPIISVVQDNINKFNDKNEYVIFSGIGNPESFKKTLTKNNFNIIKEIKFPDHYRYTQKDIDKIKLQAINLNAKILTTEKDYVKLNDNAADGIEFLEIELVIKEENELINFIKSNI